MPLTLQVSFPQKETFRPRFAKFVQCLVKTVSGLIGQRHRTPHIAEMDFVVVVKRLDKSKDHFETMRKYVHAEMIEVNYSSQPISIFISLLSKFPATVLFLKCRFCGER
jgi:hypothetical protein